MSAPNLTNIYTLYELGAGWDSYGAMPIDQRAIEAVQRFVTVAGCAVPLSDGGVQLEWHVDGWDIEIEFTPEGKIGGVLVARGD